VIFTERNIRTHTRREKEEKWMQLWVETGLLWRQSFFFLLRSLDYMIRRVRGGEQTAIMQIRSILFACPLSLLSLVDCCGCRTGACNYFFLCSRVCIEKKWIDQFFPLSSFYCLLDDDSLMVRMHIANNS
jgi:hypothetical protein